MKSRILLTSLAVTIMAVSTASAQQPKPVMPSKSVQQTKTVHKTSQPRKIELKEAQPGLRSQATVSLENALATAQKSYSGTLVSERIEKRGDQLVYRFGIRGKNKVRHVLVDAKTGEIVKPQAHPTSHTMKQPKTEK
jgi:uncharacterized membrane protein YkoI